MGGNNFSHELITTRFSDILMFFNIIFISPVRRLCRISPFISCYFKIDILVIIISLWTEIWCWYFVIFLLLITAAISIVAAADFLIYFIGGLWIIWNLCHLVQEGDIVLLLVLFIEENIGLLEFIAFSMFFYILQKSWS